MASPKFRYSPGNGYWRRRASSLWLCGFPKGEVYPERLQGSRRVRVYIPNVSAGAGWGLFTHEDTKAQREFGELNVVRL
jgi:hypothetical protein